MKKLFLSIGVIITSGVSYAQVGINEESPKATLDISIKKENETTNDLDGLLIPRVSKEKAYQMTTNVDTASNKTLLEESTLIYVNETASYTGSDATVADITGNGFYFWNGTKWVKQIGQDGQEWIYQPTSEQIELRRKSTIFYDKKAGFKNLNFESYENYNTSIQNWETINFDSRLGQDLIAKKSSKINSYTKNGKENKVLSENIILLDENSDSSNLYLTGTSSIITTEKENSQDYRFVKGTSSEVSHQGVGKIKDLAAGSFDADISFGSSDGYITALRAGTQVRVPDVNNVYGITAFTIAGRNTGGGTKEIRRIVGGNFNTFYQENSTAEVKVNAGVRVTSEFKNGANPKIDKAVGFYYEGIKGGKTGTINNHYGILLEDIMDGTNNYAVYSKAGKIRFGDLESNTVTENRLVITNKDGVLSASNAVLDDFVSLWANDDTNSQIILKNTSAGDPRANSGNNRNSVAFDNKGYLIAKGFKGYNEATIFPDYVFEKYYKGYSDIKADYNFHNLASVESFIKKNGHLPGYKSAKEIAEKGLIDFGATQLTNVEKIEELYLHTIEQEKKIEAKDIEISILKTELKSQQKQINELKALVNKLINK